MASIVGRFLMKGSVMKVEVRCPSSLLFRAASRRCGEQVQWKNRSSSATEQQHPVTRTTDHDSVDGIDSS